MITEYITCAAIWYKDDSYEDNLNRGLRIQSRLKRKKEIQEFLKY